jgi:hypothetical protein
MIQARIAADPEHRVDRPALWVRAAVNDACDACDDFRVRRWIGARLSRIVRNSYRPSRRVDNHAPNRHFSCVGSEIGLSERKRHPIFVHAVSDRMNEEARPCHSYQSRCREGSPGDFDRRILLGTRGEPFCVAGMRGVSVHRLLDICAFPCCSTREMVRASRQSPSRAAMPFGRRMWPAWAGVVRTVVRTRAAVALPWQEQCIAETAVWEMGFEMAERTLGRFARGDMQTALKPRRAKCERGCGCAVASVCEVGLPDRSR